MKYELNKLISATKYESVGGETPYIRGWNDRFVEDIQQKRKPHILGAGMTYSWRIFSKKGGGQVNQERTTLKFMNGWLTRV
jgi:hypothetical protein